MTNSLEKYLALNTHPIINVFGNGKGDREESMALMQKYHDEYMNLGQWFFNNGFKPGNITQKKAFFDKKFGKYHCCSQLRRGWPKVLTWNMLNQDMGVVTMSNRGWEFEVPYNDVNGEPLKAQEAYEIWTRFKDACYAP